MNGLKFNSIVSVVLQYGSHLSDDPVLVEEQMKKNDETLAMKIITDVRLLACKFVERSEYIYLVILNNCYKNWYSKLIMEVEND